MRRHHLAAALIALCTAATAARADETLQFRAVAILRNPSGKQVGTATLATDQAGVRIAIGVKGLPPGRHGFHLHAVARCDIPDFTSAGPHFNPLGKAHGPAGAAESHAGDLPELEADADGVAMIGFIARGITLAPGPTSLLGGAGTSLVLTAEGDDGHTEAGGARLVCGVVTKR
jgi:Cu-Zn family superoxide dismutase